MNEIQEKNQMYQKSNKEQRRMELQEEVVALEETIMDLEKKKEKLMTDLKQAIEKEKMQWLERKERERKESKELGYKIGYDEGVEKARQEWSHLLEEANHIAETANQDYYRTIEKHEEAILQLALASAEKIIKDKLVENHTYFISIIKHAIEELKDRSKIVIYVHPCQYSFLVEQKPELEQLLEENELLSIYTDKHLREDDCTIKHPFGQVEVGIDVQLEQIKNTLAEKLTDA